MRDRREFAAQLVDFRLGRVVVDRHSGFLVAADLVALALGGLEDRDQDAEQDHGHDRGHDRGDAGGAVAAQGAERLAHEEGELRHQARPSWRPWPLV